MHPFRTHTCGALRADHTGETVRLSGWVHRKRDHGNLLFLDLRDHYGVTQCVAETGDPAFAVMDEVKLESVLTVTGPVVERSEDTVNPNLPTGHVEVKVAEARVESAAAPLPLQVNSDTDYGEEVRLRHRYLDLRREKMQRNIALRSDVIASIRRRMIDQGFREFQTPILTAGSPEGARDYLVPSRLHPGRFYALPQAPQMFKQLLMIAGFDKYFQIAPCFRDEDARADRSPGEFYQLDFEMSFVTQEDVFAALEPVLHGVFGEFGGGRTVTAPPFPRIPFDEAMLKYGTDKPDLRNPLEIVDVTGAFRGSGFKIFARLIEQGAVVRAVPGPGAGSRAFCDRMNGWAQDQGKPGLGYIFWREGAGAGPIANNLGPERVAQIATRPARRTATRSSSSATSRKARPNLPESYARRSARSAASSRTTGSISAGSSISRCTRSTRRPAGWTSATTPFQCPRAGWRRWSGTIRWRSRRSSTTSSATGSNCPPARSGTTGRKSWSRRSRSPAIRQPIWKNISPAC